MKRTFYSEFAYVFGLLFLALGTALMERADFGMSMVVAPAYILHLKVSQYLPFFSFGMAEYCLQLLLIVLLSLALGKFRKGYAFSFVTAIIYGFVLDFNIMLISHIPAELFGVRLVIYIAGMIICACGVALLFHTYFAPEAYELVVKEVSAKSGKSIAKVKTVYDTVSLTVSVILSFCFFGFMHFEGVKLGTLFTALINGWMIGRISAFLENKFEFNDKLKLRKLFTV